LARRFVRQENSIGECSVADLDFGYRIYAFNTHAHGGVHVHDPDGAIVEVAVESPSQAERVVWEYSWTYPGGFGEERFRGFMNRWRYE
jgi:hypothetical protein